MYISKCIVVVFIAVVVCLSSASFSQKNNVSLNLSGYYYNLTYKHREDSFSERYYIRSGIKGYNTDSEVVHPIYFFGNGLIMEDFFTTPYDDYCKMIQSQDPIVPYRYWFERSYFGTYELHSDTILADIYQTYTARFIPRHKSILTHYRAILKNSDTITGWRICKPYPVLFDGEDQLELELSPSILVFKKFELKGLIDSSLPPLKVKH
ncbi:MAG: hypothetical protein H0X33_03010 [Taibaiella sp.]|nr:hypothetical protein [Taibaiella sp.]